MGGYGSSGKALQILRDGSICRLLKESSKGRGSLAKFRADSMYTFVISEREVYKFYAAKI